MVGQWNKILPRFHSLFQRIVSPDQGDGHYPASEIDGVRKEFSAPREDRMLGSITHDLSGIAQLPILRALRLRCKRNDALGIERKPALPGDVG
jgi:hypothetical protein